MGAERLASLHLKILFQPTPQLKNFGRDREVGFGRTERWPLTWQWAAGGVDDVAVGGLGADVAVGGLGADVAVGG